MTNQNAETERLDAQGDASPAASKPADDRIAPGVSGTTQSADETTESPAAKQPNARRARNRVVAGIAACAVVVVALVAGIGYATGAFNDASEQATSTSQQDSAAPGAAQKPESSSASQEEASGSADSSTESKTSDENASGNSESSATEQSLPATPSGEAAAQSDAAEHEGASSSASSSSSAGSSYQEPASEPAPAPAPSTISVYLSIDSSRAQAYGLGGFSYGATLELPQGATVYDALCASGAAISGSSYYVSAINGLAEKQCGNGSGWTYAVNGSFPGKACGRYTLSGGESIAWIYSTEKDPTIAM